MTSLLEELERLVVAEEPGDADQQVLVERVELARVGAQLLDVVVEVERAVRAPAAARCAA